MKLHIGVDSQSGLTHSAVVTAANVHDKHPLPDLLHGQERRVYGDSAYASQKKLIEGKAPKAKDFTNQRTRRNGVVDETLKARNRNKSRIRSRVEHVFGVVKRLWGFGQSALPRPGQERHTRIHGPGTGQHLPQPTAVDGTGAPMRAAIGPRGPRNRPHGPQETSLDGVLSRNRSVINPSGFFDGAYSA